MMKQQLFSEEKINYLRLGGDVTFYCNVKYIGKMKHINITLFITLMEVVTGKATWLCRRVSRFSRRITVAIIADKY
jgi:hypothetical protein